MSIQEQIQGIQSLLQTAASGLVNLQAAVDQVHTDPSSGIGLPVMTTIQNAANKTGLSMDSIRKGCKTGKIVHIKCGSKILVNMDRLNDLLQKGGEL